MILPVPPLLPAAEQVPGGWRPGIGDPTAFGWATVLAYLAAAVACGLAARAERRGGGHDGRGVSLGVAFWVTLAIALGVLGVNKQLDLQSAITAIGRRLAHEQGWYEARHGMQRRFILGVAVAGAALLAAVAVAFRSLVRRQPAAMLGMIFLLVFVLVRASSFHKVDLLLGLGLLGMRLNHLLELAGIALVGISAVIRIREMAEAG